MSAGSHRYGELTGDCCFSLVSLYSVDKSVRDPVLTIVVGLVYGPTHLVDDDAGSFKFGVRQVRA